MRKLLPLALFCLLFCLLTTAGFASITGPTQCTVTNGTGTGTSSSLGFTVTTSPISFATATTGNFIEAHVWVTGATTGATISNVEPASINASGQTLSFSTFDIGDFWNNSTSGHLANGSGGFFYLRNAPSILATTTFTVTGEMVGFGTPGGTLTVNVEFGMCEFSGVSTSATYDAYTRDFSNASTTVNPGTLTTTATDLVLAIFSGQGSNLTAGSGYTSLGNSASVASVGQAQYQLNVASGSVPTVFTGSENYWAGLALAFKPAASVSSAVPRRQGFVN